MENKFHLTREENIFIARRNMAEYIFNSAKLNGVEITLAQVQIICDGTTVSNISVVDTIFIYNLKRAWNLILEENASTLSEYLELGNKIGDILCYDIDKKACNVEWVHILKDISIIQNATKQAIQWLITIATSNMFPNINLEVGTMVANKIMIEHGAGIISIPIKLIEEFYAKLNHFYETKNSTELTEFLYIKCIDGIHLNKDR